MEKKSTPIPQLAVQVSIPEYLFGKVFLSKATPIEITIGLFALIAFYYMMRVGEYTVPAATDYEIGSQTRTVQFTVNDVIFWKKRGSDDKLEKHPQPGWSYIKTYKSK